MRQPGLITDTPKDADLYECRLRHGDIVLCYVGGASKSTAIGLTVGSYPRPMVSVTTYGPRNWSLFLLL